MSIYTTFVVKDTLIEQVLKNVEGRYFSDFEEKYVSNYYAQLPDKLASLKNISNKKNRVSKESIDKILNSNESLKDIPNIENYLAGDIFSIFKYASTCIISENLSDLVSLIQKYYEKYQVLDFSDENINSIFNSVKDYCSKELYNRDYELLIPYINSLNLERLKTYSRINEKLETIIIKSCEDIYNKYPQMKEKDPDSVLGIKDQKLLMQYILLSMISNNPVFITERVTYSYSIFKRLNFSNEFLIDSYKMLESELREELLPKDYYEIKKYFNAIYSIVNTNLLSILEDHLSDIVNNSKTSLMKDLNNLDANKENFIKNDLMKIMKDLFSSMLCNNYSYIREKIINMYNIMQEISFQKHDIKMIIDNLYENSKSIEDLKFFFSLIDYDNIEKSKVLFERIENNSIYNKFYKDFSMKYPKYKDIEMNFEINSLLKSSSLYMLNKNENFMKDEIETFSKIISNLNISSIKNDFILLIEEACQNIIPSDIYQDYKSYLKAFLSNI